MIFWIIVIAILIMIVFAVLKALSRIGIKILGMGIAIFIILALIGYLL